MSEFSPLGGNEGCGACADEVAKTLGIAPSSAYELMHEKDFPTLRIGSRMVIPKEKFIQWVEEHTKGGERT
ncbi:helix-turn-helix domain-containing protein [Flintibacter sp. HCN-6482]|uniref:helix-turn-helix domain-containing protein n=1 Tax=Flintibacter sp. HCN-6482 TaxID=3134672 RepID=UPI0030BFCD59